MSSLNYIKQTHNNNTYGLINKNNEYRLHAACGTLRVCARHVWKLFHSRSSCTWIIYGLVCYAALPYAIALL